MDNIVNAKDKKTNDLSSGLPDVAGAIDVILQPTRAVIVQKQQIAGRTQEVPIEISTKASVQPFTAQQLSIKPEGLRAWKWFSIFCLRNADLKPGDAFIIKGMRYKIMEKYDWSAYGYFKYDAMEDYQDVADQSHSD